MAAIKRSLNVGIIGVGHMGLPILRNLAFKSRAAMYLQLHSRSLPKVTKIADKLSQDGAPCAMRLHNRYSTLSKWSDVIIVCVANGEASRHVLLENDEAVLPNARPGQIIVDHTTSDVATARRCHAMVQSRGATYIDAPLSGNAELAHNGQLTVMAGGDEAAFQKVLPLLRLYAENITRVGDGGCGSAAKAICQSLVAVHTVAAAEAMAMAHHFGLDDAAQLLTVLDGSWGASTMLRRNGRPMQNLLRNPEVVPDESPVNVDWMLSDLAVASRSIETGGTQQLGGTAPPPMRLPLLEKSRRVFARASMAGVGANDISAVVHFVDADVLDAVAAPSPSVASPSQAVETRQAADPTPGATSEEMEFY